MTRDSKELLAEVREHYRASHGFNGLPLHSVDTANAHLSEVVIDLIRQGHVDLVRGDGHPNPHIKALPAEPIDVQISKIEAQGLGTGCLYPTPKHLWRFRSSVSQDAPFTRELELGAAQLEFRVFDLRVLESYRNDPRYDYEADNSHGRIRRRDESTGAAPIVQDKLSFLEFGFAYNDELDRAWVCFLRYLRDLPPELQQFLAMHQLDGTYKLHPDFYQTRIVGAFPVHVSIYDAFLAEKHIINAMCRRIGKAPLFRTSKGRPSGFGILIRPTKKEFRDFVLLLDQLLSDDLNYQFFEGDISTTKVLMREDGSKHKHKIGTITLLETWFQTYFQSEEPEVIDQLFKNLREIREARQKPAHKVEDNQFDPAYIKAQQELITKGYDAVGTIRMALENHTNVRGYAIPRHLREARVRVR